jgi:N-acyl-D-aspartate/D-glutamate deacylase
MGEMRAGVFEIARENNDRDPEKVLDYITRLKALAVDTGVPITFGLTHSRKTPQTWRPLFQMVDDTNAAGGKMLVQGHSRSISVLISFETTTPFDKAPVWCDIRKLPLAEQEAALRNPEIRRKMVEAAHERMRSREQTVGAEPRRPEFDWLFVLDKPLPPYRSIGEIAREQNKDPIEVMIDLALAKHLKQFFQQPLVNEDQDYVLAGMRHPRSVVTFSDSGAHVSQIMDSSIQTHLLSYWVREKEAFTLEQAVRKITYDLAAFWGLNGRGYLREGAVADLAIFDPQTVGPQMPVLEHDLPSGARRLKQKANGMLATVVNGQVVLRNNEHTGALPGQLLRGPLAAG